MMWLRAWVICSWLRVCSVGTWNFITVLSWIYPYELTIPLNSFSTMVQFEVHLPVKIARSISLLLCCFKQRAVITLLCDLLSHSNLSAMSLKLCLSLLLFYDVSPIGSYSFLSIHSNNHTLILPILYYELFATNL